MTRKALILSIAAGLSLAAGAANGTESLFADRRAKKVGDIVTVVIVQSSAASHQAQHKTDKKTSAEAEPATGLLRLFPDLSLSAQRSTSGAGATSDKTSLSDAVTCTVIELLPSGALKIEGRRNIWLHADKLEAVLSGMVRSDDIRPDNTVLSTSLADLSIRISGKGPIAEQRRPGLISRLLQFLW